LKSNLKIKPDCHEGVFRAPGDQDPFFFPGLPHRDAPEKGLLTALASVWDVERAHNILNIFLT
jgi:hypothetical protein